MTGLRRWGLLAAKPRTGGVTATQMRNLSLNPVWAADEDGVKCSIHSDMLPILVPCTFCSVEGYLIVHSPSASRWSGSSYAIPIYREP